MTLILAAVWRSLVAHISLKLVFLESSGYLVSIGSDLMRFEARVVEILYLEGRWCNAKNLIALFLKKSFHPIWRRYRQPFLWKVANPSCFNLFQVVRTGCGWISTFYCMKRPKKLSFYLKNNIFNQDFGIFNIFYTF